MDDSELHRLVYRWEQRTQQAIEAKAKADVLEEDMKPYLASLMNTLDDGKKSESRLDREARGSKEFRSYVVGMCAARAEALRLKAKAEALDKLIDVRRSELAMQREKISKGIFHVGG